MSVPDLEVPLHRFIIGFTSETKRKSHPYTFFATNFCSDLVDTIIPLRNASRHAILYIAQINLLFHFGPWTWGSIEGMAKKPSIRMLQQFSNGYFKRNRPKLEWSDGEFSGCSMPHENCILLKPYIPLKLEGCRGRVVIGTGYYVSFFGTLSRHVFVPIRQTWELDLISYQRHYKNLKTCKL
jgi:hypothetical protein